MKQKIILIFSIVIVLAILVGYLFWSYRKGNEDLSKAPKKIENYILVETEKVEYCPPIGTFCVGGIKLTYKDPSTNKFIHVSLQKFTKGTKKSG